MSSSKIKNELDRRSFLKNMLAGAGFITSFPGEMFLSNMMMHFLQKGYAQAAGLEGSLEDFKFINIGINGGIPRWYWDGVLRPNGNDHFVPNPFLITKFARSGSGYQGQYATIKIGNYHLPWTWAARIPTSNGGSVPMSALAQNMLTLRGINSLIDSHDLNKARHIVPVPGGVSLTGMIADKASTPIPAIDRGGNNSYFGSSKGIAAVSAGGTNPLNSVLTPFLPGNNIIGLKTRDIDSAIENALKQMSQLSEDKHKHLPSSYDARINAKNLMKKNFGNLQETFTSISGRYKGLISRSFSLKESNLILEGVDDISIPGEKSTKFLVEGDYYFTGRSIQEITTEATMIGQLADSFAVAEFMIKENLSSAINLIIGNLANTFMEQRIHKTTGSIINGTASNVAYTNDIHFTGSNMALILFSRYYRAFSACLYELIQQFKSIKTSRGNLFNQMVIGVNTEFNRLPRKDGSGADHGWDGNVQTMFSGQIEQVTILGNIKDYTRSTAANPASSLGSWGQAGHVKELAGREAILGNAITTLSELLELKTPTPNDQGFVVKQNGKVRVSMNSCENQNIKGEAA